MKNCYFSGKVGNSLSSRCGGIIGCGHANLENCFLDGILEKGSDGYAFAGGIAAELSSGTIKNCYSIANYNYSENAGFICRVNSKNCYVENSYSIAIKNGYGAIYREGLTPNVKNTFYLIDSYRYAASTNATYTGVTAKDETYMKSQAFVDELNKGTDVWTRDNNINEGYPILRTIKYRK